MRKSKGKYYERLIENGKVILFLSTLEDGVLRVYARREVDLSKTNC